MRIIFCKKGKGFVMALFEKNYKKAALEDIERNIRELEERTKTQSKLSFDKELATVQGNLNFAVRLNLVSLTQADLLRERIVKIQKEHEANSKKENQGAAKTECKSADEYSRLIAERLKTANSNSSTSSKSERALEETALERTH